MLNPGQLLAQITAIASREGPQRARAALQQAVAGQKPDPDLLTLEGQLALQCADPEGARTAFRKALDRMPEEPQFQQNLATVLVRTERPDLALPLVRQARRKRPRDAGLLKLMVETLTALGRSQEVIDLLQTARETGLEDPGALLDLARARQEMGDRTDATQTFRDVLQTGSLQSGALFGLARSAEDPGAEPGLATAADTAAEPGTRPEDQVRLHLAQAIAEDRAGRPADAFPHYMQSNALAFAGRRDARDLDRAVTRMTAELGPDWFAERARWGLGSRRPVFVVGMPRSGTTLVEQILASHPDIAGAGEIGFFRYQDSLHTPRTLTRQTTRDIARDYLTLLKAFDRDRARVVDKMPLNALRLWLIATAFPRATILHCTRDPVATCVSILTSGMGAQHGYVRRQEDLARAYLAYRRMMTHWQAVLPVEIHEIRYEDLVSTPEPRIRDMIAATDLDWDPACLDFHRTRRSVRTPSREQVSRPINTEGLTKWRRFAPFVDPLISALEAGGIRTNN